MAPTACKSFSAGNMFSGSLIKMLFAFWVCVFLFAEESNATHFRYGNVTWTRGSGNTVTFYITQAWRRSFAWNTTPLVGGVPVFTGNFFFGDSAQAPMNVNVTAVNSTENWFYGVATVTHTYSGPGPWTAYFGSCCRISSLQNNFDGNFKVETLVDLTERNNSPISTLQPIVNLPTGLSAASFTIPASDPDGDTISFSLSTPGQMGDVTLTQPPGIAIDPSSGVVTFNTIGRTVGEMWNASVRVDDGNGGVVTLDFLVNIVAQSNPPYFNYTVTPFNGQIFHIQPGATLTFPVQALDADSGDIVTLQGFGLPIGSSMSPTLPLNGNPVQSVFTWTPTLAQIRTRIVSFMAQDLSGNQASTSVTIVVSLNPVFDSPPTPPDGSGFCIPSGSLYQTAIQAHAPDSLMTVQITSAVIPAGASLTPVLPTPSGNVSSTLLEWTPSASDWGPNNFSFTATDAGGNSTSTGFSLIVNTPTVIVSSPPSLTIRVNQLFTYLIQASDPDVPFGDEIAILGIALPSWLTLTDNGNGTALLSGTPAFANAGNNSVHIDAEDIYHHCFGHGTQSFNIYVEACKLTARITPAPAVVSGYCFGQPVDLTVTPADSYSWSSGDTTKTIHVIANGIVTYSVTITTGYCSATTSFTVSASPNVAPVAVCKNISVSLDSSGHAAITAADVDGGSFDNCGGVIRAVSQSSFNCSAIGPTPVTLTVTDNGGLSSSCQALITVTGQSAVCSASSDVGTIYLGYGPQTATLSVRAPAATSYMWSPAIGLSCTACSSPMFTPTSEGMYTFQVLVTSASGCKSVCSITVCVLDIRVPGSEGDKIYVCHAHPVIPGSSQTLALSINAVASHVPGHIGDHYGRCDQQCVSTSKAEEEQIGELLPDENGEGFEMILYPNPFNTHFQLRIESNKSELFDITMFDVTGKLVLEATGNSPTQQVELGEGLSQGIYFVRVKQGDSSRMLRIVKGQ
ncbi:MAG: T9SS type A sorting domain-containing protein [Bacteroidota bacterium]